MVEKMVRLMPMTESEFGIYLEKTVPEYAADKTGAGDNQSMTKKLL